MAISCGMKDIDSPTLIFPYSFDVSRELEKAYQSRVNSLNKATEKPSKIRLFRTIQFLTLQKI